MDLRLKFVACQFYDKLGKWDLYALYISSPQLIFGHEIWVSLFWGHGDEGGKLKFPCLRATSPVLSMWCCKLQLDEAKLKHAMLAWLGPTFLQSLLRLVKRTAKPNTCRSRSVINMIWLRLPVSRWFAISTLSPTYLFVIPVLVLWVGLEKSK
jgi:hypothetical protein